MLAADRGSGALRRGEGLTIGIVRARFNEGITARMAEACRTELDALGVSRVVTTLVEVPGALEIPVVLDALARSRRFDALIAIGCVIRGETYHFELVSNECAAGIGRVSLDHGLAIANAVLTVENEAQAWARAEAKGRDAARVAVEMAWLMKEL